MILKRFVKQLNIQEKRWVCKKICLFFKIKFIIIAKIHCVSDTDSIDREQNAGQLTNLIPFEIIPRNTERTIRDAIVGKEEAFIQDMLSFAMVSCFK